MVKRKMCFLEHLPPNMTLWRLSSQIQIILMIVLSKVEGHGLSDLRGGMITHLYEFAKNLYGNVALFGVFEPNGRKVLCPDVDPLAVGLFKVMDFKEIAY